MLLLLPLLWIGECVLCGTSRIHDFSSNPEEKKFANLFLVAGRRYGRKLLMDHWVVVQWVWQSSKQPRPERRWICWRACTGLWCSCSSSPSFPSQSHPLHKKKHWDAGNTQLLLVSRVWASFLPASSNFHQIPSCLSYHVSWPNSKCMWPCKRKLDEEKWKHAGLAQQNSFGPALLFKIQRLVKGPAKPN